MITVDEIPNDADVSSQFQIIRQSPGTFVSGGWLPGATTVIQTFGATRNTAGKELEMVPEADRNRELLTFRCAQQTFFETSEDKSLTSDLLLFQSEVYRVLGVKNYTEQGYSFAIATKIAGQ